MTSIVGIRFRNAGKAYSYDPKDFDLKTGDRVVVETVHGMELGRVVLPKREVEDSAITHPLRSIIRPATPEDKQQEIINIEKEKEAYRLCAEKIREHGLEMKLIKAEYTFDNKKLLFYFTADGRIDFRELVRDLAALFKTRIELRQIGVRDETKVLGGIGICGRELCCASYLTDFAPVSIRMAKEQNLSLNPSKISGVCGRLLCCLKNEQAAYEYLNRKMPRMGEEVITKDGEDGEVVSMNILRQTVRVLTENGDEKDITEYPVDELELTGHRKKKNPGNRKGKEASDTSPSADQDKQPKGKRARSLDRKDKEEKDQKETREGTRTERQERASKPEGRERRSRGSGRSFRRERKEGEEKRSGRDDQRREDRPLRASRSRSEMRKEARLLRENNRSREGAPEEEKNTEGRRRRRPRGRGHGQNRPADAGKAK